MLDLIVVILPVLDKIDAHLGVGGIEGDLVDKAKAMHQPCGAVVSFVHPDTPRLCCRSDLGKEPGMVTFFDAQNIVQTVGVQGLDVRGIGTQAVFRDDEFALQRHFI